MHDVAEWSPLPYGPSIYDRSKLSLRVSIGTRIHVSPLEPFITDTTLASRVPSHRSETPSSTDDTNLSSQNVSSYCMDITFGSNTMGVTSELEMYLCYLGVGHDR